MLGMKIEAYAFGAKVTTLAARNGCDSCATMELVSLKIARCRAKNLNRLSTPTYW